MKRLLFFGLFIFIIFPSLSQNKLDSALLISAFKSLSADEMQGRKTGTEGSQLAQKFITDQFSKTGLVAYFPEYKQRFSFERNGKSIEGTNLVAYIPGTSEYQLIISAHYDHLGETNGKVYNGADDNASGVAALLSIADYFQNNKPYHTLVFVCFDAEELGIKGSDAFVNSMVFEKEKVALVVNLDMISRSTKNEIYLAGTYHNAKLRKLIQKATIPSLGMKVLLGHDSPKSKLRDWTNDSDHIHFHKKGIPFLYFGVEDHPHYHKVTDVFETVDLAFYQKVCETILNYLIYLDSQLEENPLK